MDSGEELAQVTESLKAAETKDLDRLYKMMTGIRPIRCKTASGSGSFGPPDTDPTANSVAPSMDPTAFTDTERRPKNGAGSSERS